MDRPGQGPRADNKQFRSRRNARCRSQQSNRADACVDERHNRICPRRPEGTLFQRRQIGAPLVHGSVARHHRVPDFSASLIVARPYDAMGAADLHFESLKLTYCVSHRRKR